MNISNNFNVPNFKGTCINKTRMNPAQRKLANRLSELVVTHKDYNEIAKKKVDLCFLPTKAPESIMIKAIDLMSGKFIKVEGTERAQHITVNSNGDKFQKADEILEFYKKASLSERPEINAEDILKGRTALLKANPSLHEDIIENYDVFQESLGEEIAKELAVDEFIETLPEEGFNFNY